MESALLTLCAAPSSGIFKLKLDPCDGSAPSNSMVTYEGDEGGGVDTLSVQQIERTVCGGPTVQTPAPWETSAAGTSTVVRVHWREMSMSQSEGTDTEEMESTLFVSWDCPSKGTATV